MCKSILYTKLATPTTVAAGATVPLGLTARRFGCAIRQDGNAIDLLEAGYYRISVCADVQPTAATAITLAVVENGTATGSATAIPAAAAADTNMVVPAAVVRVYCGSTKTIMITLSAEAEVQNMAVTVEKV